MKTKSTALGILLLFTLLLSPLLGDRALAQMENDSPLLMFNASYGFGKHNLTGEDLEGYGFSGAYEKVDWQGQFGGGFSISWISFENDSTAASTPDSASYTIDSYPIYLYGKRYFGSPNARFYIGLGMGVHVSKVKRFKGDSQTQTEDKFGGVALGAPVGLYLFLSRGLFVNVNYTFNYLKDSPFQDDLLHMGSVGIGFQM
jgi:hypothetical protein